MNRLGKGLKALVNEGKSDEDENKFHLIKIDKIGFNPFQPRKDSNEQNLQELSKSIEENGIIQPVIVRKIEPDKFELIAGQRRITAAQLAGLEKVPAVIRDAKNFQMLSLSVIENIQRENLNPIEEARAYEKLVNEFGLKQNEIAKICGKSRVSITNTLRLLKLPEEIINMLKNNSLSSGHARAVLQLETELQTEFAQTIVKNNLSVHKAEKLAKSYKKSKIKKRHLKKDVHLIALENDLSKIFGSKVNINGQQKGTIEIKFYSEEELDGIIQKLLDLQ